MEWCVSKCENERERERHGGGWVVAGVHNVRGPAMSSTSNVGRLVGVPQVEWHEQPESQFFYPFFQTAFAQVDTR